jgi:hypothetical protein
MNLKNIVYFLFFFPVILMAQETQFKREASSITWHLVIKDNNYTISECGLDGKIKQSKGGVAKGETELLFKDSKSGTARSFVDGKRFIERQVHGIIYLIEKERMDDFQEALDEKDAFAREMFLRDYFRKQSNGCKQQPNGEAGRQKP